MESIGVFTPSLADTLKYEWRPANVISRRPPVIYTIYNGLSDQFFVCSVINHYVSSPMLFIVTPWHSIEGEFRLTGCSNLLARVAEFNSLYPNSRLVFFCNTTGEAEILSSLGIDAFVHNQNCLVNEQHFYINPKLGHDNRRFAAVYNAQMSPFKRHGLASDVRGLALIYNIFGEEGEHYLEYVRGILPYATFCNNISADEGPANRSAVNKYRKLTVDDVRRIYNSSGVGLCLSETEGAMYASMEYLLCGLPIVSTPSLGGRDFYFDPNWVLLAEPDSISVARAVDSIVTCKVDREFIRRSVFEMVEDERCKFIARLNALKNDIDRHGIITVTRMMRHRNGLTGMQPIGILSELFQGGATS